MCYILQRKQKHVFTFYAIARHWHDTYRWNPFSCKTMIFLVEPGAVGPVRAAFSAAPTAAMSMPTQNGNIIMSSTDMTTWFKQALQGKDIQELLSSAIGVGHTVRNNTNRITELDHELSTLRIDLEEQRQYSRRNAIRIYNTDWQNESREENTDLMVLNLLWDNLGLTSLTAADISRSHRVGRPGQGNGPRPILVKFIGYRTKEAVMKKKKDLPNHVQIYDDLSKYMSALAYEARQLKRSHLICDTWVYDGRVYVKPTARDKPVVVLSPEYLADVIPPEGTLVSFADATHGRPAPRRFTRDDATGQGTRSSTLSMRSSTGSHRVHTRPINDRQSAPIAPNLPFEKVHEVFNVCCGLSSPVSWSWGEKRVTRGQLEVRHRRVELHGFIMNHTQFVECFERIIGLVSVASLVVLCGCRGLRIGWHRRGGHLDRMGGGWWHIICTSLGCGPTSSVASVIAWCLMCRELRGITMYWLRDWCTGEGHVGATHLGGWLGYSHGGWYWWGHCGRTYGDLREMTQLARARGRLPSRWGLVLVHIGCTPDPLMIASPDGTQTRTDDVPSSPTHSVEMSSPSVSTDTQPPTSAQDNEAGDADETYDSLEISTNWVWFMIKPCSSTRRCLTSSWPRVTRFSPQDHETGEDNPQQTLKTSWTFSNHPLAITPVTATRPTNIMVIYYM